MGIKEILVGLFRGKSGKDGIWDFLGKRSADKSRVELAETLDDGAQKLIPLLQPGVVLIQSGPDWFREIRMPEVLPPGMLITSVAAPPAILPANELEAAPRDELEAAPQDELEAAPGQAQGPADGPC